MLVVGANCASKLSMIFFGGGLVGKLVFGGPALLVDGAEVLLPDLSSILGDTSNFGVLLMFGGLLGARLSVDVGSILGFKRLRLYD